MRVVIVYESMFGNTHLIADAIAEGLALGNEVTVVPVARAGRELLDGADLVVAGGPTHIHGAGRAPARVRRRWRTRTAASSPWTPARKGRACVTGSPAWGRSTPGERHSIPGSSARRCSPGARQRRSPSCWSGTGSRSSLPPRASW